MALDFSQYGIPEDEGALDFSSFGTPEGEPESPGIIDRVKSALTPKEQTAPVASADEINDSAQSVEAPAMPDRSWGEVATDTGISLRKGGASVLKSAGFLSDMMNPITALQRISGGDTFNKEFAASLENVTKEIEEGYSAKRKAQGKAYDATDGFVETAQFLLQNPSYVGDLAAESAVGTAVAGVAGRVAGTAMGALENKIAQQAAEKGAAWASGAAEAAQALGQVASDIEERLDANGVTDSRQRALALSASIPAGIATFVFGRMGGSVESKLLGKGFGEVGENAIKVVGKDLVKEAGEEFFQSGGEQFFTNLGQRTAGDQIDLSRGVAKAAATGGIVGAAQGGGISAARATVDAIVPGAPPAPPGASLPETPPESGPDTSPVSLSDVAEVLQAGSVDEAIAAAETTLATQPADIIPEVSPGAIPETAPIAAPVLAESARPPVEPGFDSAEGVVAAIESARRGAPLQPPNRYEGVLDRVAQEAQAQPAEPASASRPTEGMTMPELTMALRLTRSDERRAAISAEIERRAKQPAESISNEKSAALDQVAAATARVRGGDASAQAFAAMDAARAAAESAGASPLEVMQAIETAKPQQLPASGEVAPQGAPDARAVEDAAYPPESGSRGYEGQSVGERVEPAAPAQEEASRPESGRPISEAAGERAEKGVTPAVNGVMPVAEKATTVAESATPVQESPASTEPVQAAPAVQLAPQNDRSAEPLAAFAKAQPAEQRLTRAEVRRVIEPVVASWANPPAEIEVINSMEDAPEGARGENDAQLKTAIARRVEELELGYKQDRQVRRLVDRIKKERGLENEAAFQAIAEEETMRMARTPGGRPYAFFHEGKVFLVASEIADEAQAIRGLYHESLGHFGLHGTFGKGIDAELAKIVAGRKMEVMQKARDYGLDPLKREDLLIAAEEVLAELAETRPEIGIVRRAIAAIRSALRKAGLKIPLSDDEVIRNFILPARNFVERGAARKAESNAAPEGPAKLARMASDKNAAAKDTIPAAASESTKAIDKATGLPLNKDGTVTVYHHTSRDAAAKIRATGTLKAAAEPDVYVTTRAEPDTGYGDTAVPIRVRPEKLQLDDEFPSGRRDFRLNVGKPGGTITVRVERESSAGNSAPATNRAAFARAKPADKAKKPLSASGPIDSLLARLGGEALAKRLTIPVYDRIVSLGRFVPERVKAGIVADYGLPQEYLDRRTETKIQQRKGAKQAERTVAMLGGLDRGQSRVAYQWMTQREAAGDTLLEKLPESEQAILRDLKDYITELGREAVALGQLSPESFERNKMAYLHRTYSKFELEDTKQQQFARSRAIKILGEQYKGRGLIDQAEPGNVSGKPEQGKKYVRVEKAGESKYFPATGPIPAKYAEWRRDAAEWEVRYPAKKDGAPIGMWRDFTEEERKRMGELDEVKYAVAKTLLMMTKDIETGRLLQWVGENYGKDSPDGLDVVDTPTGRGLESFKAAQWVQVPTSNIPGTQVKTFGELAGKYIPSAMWNDIRQVATAKFNPFGEVYGSILRGWKISKTALSPAVHANNIMSNVILADMADIGGDDMYRAATIFVQAKLGKDETAQRLLARYDESGGELGSYALTELQNKTIEPLLAAMRKEIEGKDADASRMIGASFISDLLRGRASWREMAERAKGTRPVKIGRAGAKAMIDLYQSEDQFFRFATWYKAVSEGRTDVEAGTLAREAFLNYEINAPWIANLRATVLPFIAFSYRAVPLVLKAAAEKPWKLAKYGAIAGGLNAMSYAALGLGGADEDRERKLLPEEKSGRLWGVFPRLVRLPWNDKHGSPVFLDIRRWVPVGDVIDFGQREPAVPIPASLYPGGPLVIFAEIVLNKQAFNAQPIVLETDSPAEQAEKFLDYMFKTFAPNMPLPNPVGLAAEAAGAKRGFLQTHSMQNILDAGRGVTDPFGREMNLRQALQSSIGVKEGSYPADVLMKNLRGKLDHDLMELDLQFSKIKRQYSRNGLTDAEFDSAVEKHVSKKQKLIEEFEKKLD